LAEPTLPRILHEADTQRKELIKRIQSITGARLIVYTANPNFSPNFIDQNDIRFVNDLLQSIGDVEKLDLMLNSPGGEPETAEKIAMMCRAHCQTFRVIVPNSAKSAATMIALASDYIVMGYLSEIGPIDPQIRVVTPEGRFHFVPAHAFIDSFRGLQQQIIQGTPPHAVIPSLQQLRPELIDMCLKAIAFSKQFAENWLSKHMLRYDVEKAKEVAKELANIQRWLSHGKVISCKDAKELGLVVEEVPKNSELWKLIWELHCRSEHLLNITNNVKLFENEKINLTYAIGRVSPPARGQSE